MPTVGGGRAYLDAPNLQSGVQMVYMGANVGRGSLTVPKGTRENGDGGSRYYTYQKGKPFYVDERDVDYLLNVKELGAGYVFAYAKEEKVAEPPSAPVEDRIGQAWTTPPSPPKSTSEGGEQEPGAHYVLTYAEEQKVVQPSAASDVATEEKLEQEARAAASKNAIKEAEAAGVTLRDVATVASDSADITVYDVRRFVSKQEEKGEEGA